MSLDLGGNKLYTTSIAPEGQALKYIVRDNLLVYLDAANINSYPKTGTAWNDLSGYGYNSTLQGATVVYSVVGGYVNFNGSTNYTSLYSIPDAYWNAGSWTVSLWCYMPTVNKGADNAFVSHGAVGTNNGLHLCERSAKAYFGMYSNDTTGTITLNSATWYNIVYTFNYSTKLKQIYVNGVFDTSGGSVGYGGTGTNTEIGRFPWSTGSVMLGYIPTVIFYNKVISATEVTQNYYVQKARFGL